MMANNLSSHLHTNPHFFLLSQLAKTPPEVQLLALFQNPALLPEIMQMINSLIEVGVQPIDIVNAGIATEVVLACLDRSSSNNPKIHEIASAPLPGAPHSSSINNFQYSAQGAIAAPMSLPMGVPTLSTTELLPSIDAQPLAITSKASPPPFRRQSSPPRKYSSTVSDTVLSNNRVNQQASELNQGKKSVRPFVQEIPQNFVIDMSDSSDDDGPSTKKKDVKRKLVKKELEIKRVLELIELKKREKDISTASSSSSRSSLQADTSCQTSSKAPIVAVNAIQEPNPSLQNTTTDLFQQKYLLESEVNIHEQIVSVLDTEMKVAESEVSEASTELEAITQKIAIHRTQLDKSFALVSELENQLKAAKVDVQSREALVLEDRKSENFLISKKASLTNKLIKSTTAVADKRRELNDRRSKLVAVTTGMIHLSHYKEWSKSKQAPPSVAISKRKQRDTSCPPAKIPKTLDNGDGYLSLNVSNEASRPSIPAAESYLSKPEKSISQILDIIQRHSTKSTITPLYSIDGYLQSTAEMLLVSDLYDIKDAERLKIDVNGNWGACMQSVAKNGIDSAVCLRHDNLMSDGPGDGVDPSRRFCVYETNGGICGDSSCKSQHFKDAKQIAVNRSGNHEDISVQGPSRVSNLLQSPVLLLGLDNILKDIVDTPAPRYFDASPLTDDDFEILVKKSPTNSMLWVQWATSTLPPCKSRAGDDDTAILDTSSLNKSGTTLNKALNVLARGLQANRSCPIIWNFYMELYSRRGLHADIRNVFSQAVSGNDFVRKNNLMWWRWIIWEGNPRDKKDVLGAFFRRVAIEDAASGTMDGSLVVEIVVQISRMYALMGHGDKSENFLHKFLAVKVANVANVASELGETWEPSGFQLPQLDETWAFQKLEPALLCKLWMFYIHLLYYKHFPAQSFHEYPHDYRLRSGLFQIEWVVIESVNRETMRDIQYLFRFIRDGWGPMASRDKDAYISVLRNVRSFKRFSRDSTGISEMFARALTKNGAMDELFDLGISSGDQNASDQALDLMKMKFSFQPHTFSLWNRYCKVAWSAGKIRMCILGLVNCIRVCFLGYDIIEELPNTSRELQELLHDTIMLYGTLFQLDSVDVPMTEKFDLHPKLDQNQARLSTHLWMNFLVLKSMRITIDGLVLNKTSDVHSMFQLAIKRSPKSALTLFWKEYAAPTPLNAPRLLEYETRPPPSHYNLSHINGPKDLILELEAALQDISISKPYPTLFDGKSDGDHHENVFGKCVPIKDYVDARLFAEIVVKTLPVDKLRDLLDVLVIKLPGVLACSSLVSVIFLSFCAKDAKAAFYSVIRECPNYEFLWRIAIDIESAGPDSTIFSQARIHIPNI